MECPLCNGMVAPFLSARGREYLLCSGCHSVMMDPSDRPSLDEEERRYLLHRNDPSDPGYRAFVRPLVETVLAYIDRDDRILDYGSGSGSAVSAMLREEGLSIDEYDPIFHPQPPEECYDVIILCEVVEHFREPAQEFRHLSSLVRGHLIIMTDPFTEDRDFHEWYYKDDQTHMFLYSRRAISMLPGFQLVEDLGRVFVLTPARPSCV